MKGYRKDGVFCFMKAFDMCPTADCTCERPAYSEESERYARIATMMMEEHEDIYEEE